MTKQSPEDFAAAFPLAFRRSAFRLELLDRYVAANENEPYRRFLAGQPQDPAWREPWKRFIRGTRRGGRQMARVHVVSEPLTDYLQFELTCAYPANVAAGEDVRILRRQNWPHLRLTDHDFWLFDDHEAAALDYDGDGNWLSITATDDPEIVRRYCRVRDLAMRHSVPVGDYLGSLGLKEAV